MQTPIRTKAGTITNNTEHPCLNLSTPEEKQEPRLARRRSASASRADLFYLLNPISFVQLFLKIEDVSMKPINVIAVAVSIRVAQSAHKSLVSRAGHLLHPGSLRLA